MYLAILNLKRDIRALEWLLIFFAVFISVVTITALHFYTDRIERGIKLKSAEILGGEVVVESSYPLSSTMMQLAKDLHLKHAEVISYPSVISANGKFQLVTVQAVSKEYPVLKIKTLKIPDNKVYAEPRSISDLKINPGASIKLGNQFFIVDKILTSDVDAMNTGLWIAPRIMLNLSDALKSGTIIPGSRIQYRLLLSGESKGLNDFQAKIAPSLKPYERIITLTNQETFLSQALTNIINYLSLVLMLSLFMAGSVIFLSSTEYLRRHYKYVALWRCLGASRKTIITVLILQLIIIAGIAGFLGSLCGYFAQNILDELFSTLLPFSLPAPSIKPFISGFIFAILLLFIFSLPTLFNLFSATPISIWRKTNVSSINQSLLLTLLTVIGIFILVFTVLDFSLLALWFIYISSVTVAILYFISLMIFAFLKKVIVFTNGSIRNGLRQLLQFQDIVSLQFISIALILSLLIALHSLQAFLIDAWQKQLPVNTPNYFAFNLAQEDVTVFAKILKLQRVPPQSFYPMVRGRLVAKNNQDIMQTVSASKRNHNALHRELNLSFMDQFPADNRVIEGSMWRTHFNNPVVSVEERLANDLDIHLNDELTFQIGDMQLRGKVVNIRKVDWTSFHPNFFMIFPKALLDDLPATYVTSFYLPTNSNLIINTLLQSLPNMTIIDVASLLQQIKIILNAFIIIVRYLFYICLVLGALLFLSSLQVTHHVRHSSYAIMHLLGATKIYIRKSIMIEFFVLFISIVISSFILGELSSLLLQKYFIL